MGKLTGDLILWITSELTSFESHHERYEAWFTRYEVAYHCELLAVRALLPWEGLGLEIGVGTGRFAAPLGIEIGVDPSRAMLAYAAKRGVWGLQGTAEARPFKSTIFDFVDRGSALGRHYLNHQADNAFAFDFLYRHTRSSPCQNFLWKF